MFIRLSGYQGAASVHTRGLHHLAARLSSLGLAPEVREDVTASGATAKSLFEEVETQDAHLCYMASGYLTGRVASLAILDLPLTVSDRSRAHKALDGLTGRILTDAIAQDTDFHVLGYWDNGVRHISNRCRPIRRPDDCAGLVIRTLDNELYQATLRAFGFQPVVTDVRDLVRAVADGTVDAQENPLTNMLTFGLHEHHRFLSLTGHIFGVALLLCRAEWFRSLPPEMSAAISAAAAEASHAQRAWAIQEDSLCLERLRGFGVQVLDRSDLDMEAFKRAARPIVSEAMSRLHNGLTMSYFGQSDPLAAR